MIAAEQFRRRLMANNRMDIDCGYVTINVVTSYQSGQLRLTNGLFDIGKISSIYINDEVVPVTDAIDIGVYTTNVIRVHYRNLYKCDDMFANLRVITSTLYETVDVDVSMLNTAPSTSFERMFSQDYENVTGLSNLDTSNATSFKEIFESCRPRNDSMWLDIKNWNTSNVKDFSGAFKDAVYGRVPTKTIIDISGWDMSNAVTMKDMFLGANVKGIKMLGKINPQADVTNIFYGMANNGTFYYNEKYDYSQIIAQLPSTWTAIPVTQ